MARPNIYNLSSTIELMVYVRDTNGLPVVPTEARLTIDVPNNTSITVSGAAMTEGDGYLSYNYLPTVSGWYAYEAWAADDYGNEVSKSNMFVITDRIS